ncbi:unnamed protein product [Adineta ricciae]|uniref:CUE domain-containing protein n=2 Tax=Adineta ricciae TaxID=249248 RepID=A0A814HNT0_ADIRI|nr:unnamed protein product [Adineta ricciae]
MATTQQQTIDEQLRILKERFPQVDESKLACLCRRHNGNIEQVAARLAKRESRMNKFDSLETRFGPNLTALQQEYPSIQSMKRGRLLKTMERYGGDVDQVRKFAQKVEARHHREGEHGCVSRHQHREELKTKYAKQLAELSSAGINVDQPWTLRLLEKQQGDVNKVMEIMTRRAVRKEKFAGLDEKYAEQIAQLKADGVQVKNDKVLARLLERSNGQTDLVKQLIAERQEKHSKRKEYRRKHRSHSPMTTTTASAGEHEEGHHTRPHWRKHHDISDEDLGTVKNLRAAGLHGNPRKLLANFRECGGSIELMQARMAEERDKRSRQREERTRKRTVLAEVQSAYIEINNRESWPRDIEHVYLDGNNMMFVVNSLRRLCLNRAGQRTERAMAEIAAAWNEQMRIPNIDLVFDSTHQLDQVGTVKVSSAQPRYRTTDDMLVEIARRPENREKNKRTIIVTSDRALAALLQREGCLLVKPYNWFAHCVMVLTPDLINYEEITGMMTTESSPTTMKIRYNFDELVHRIANIDL